MIDEKTSTEIKDFMKEIKTGKVCESEVNCSIFFFFIKKPKLLG